MKKLILIATILFSISANAQLTKFATANNDLWLQTVSISGHVFNDANGLTDLQINGSGGALCITNGMNVYLVDPSTNQIQQAVYSVLDYYAFYDVPVNTTYRVCTSWGIQKVGGFFRIMPLPSAWITVGENLGAGPLSGSDHVPDGMLTVDVDTFNIEEANFAIKLRW